MPVLAVGAVTAVWVAWLVALPDAEGAPGSSARDRVVSTTAEPTDDNRGDPADPVDSGARAGEPVVAGTVRERPQPDTSSTADVVVALAGVLALDEAEAVAWAEANGYLWRVTWRDGESFVLTFDHVPERINLEITDGTVVFAWFG
jgi:hypothetical protein